MPNIGSLLKEEIARLSRREIRRQVGPLRKIAWHSRLEIAALKRRLAEADKRLALMAKQQSRQPVAAADMAASGKQVRFVAKGLRSLRYRLGLSAEGLAKLVGVSAQSVYNWETKKAVPRKEQMAAIVSIRLLGKREAQARLDGMSKPEPARKASKRARTKRRARAK